jgi:hypothetical protein
MKMWGVNIKVLGEKLKTFYWAQVAMAEVLHKFTFLESSKNKEPIVQGNRCSKAPDWVDM